MGLAMQAAPPSESASKPGPARLPKPGVSGRGPARDAN
jgi:hypothetical protein